MVHATGNPSLTVNYLSFSFVSPPDLPIARCNFIDPFHLISPFLRRGGATDSTIIPGIPAPYRAAAPFRPLSPPRGTQSPPALGLKRESTRLGQQIAGIPSRRVLSQGRHPLLRRLCPLIIISTSPRCGPISCSARLNRCSFITYEGRPMRLSSRAVFPPECPRRRSRKSHRRASVSSATARHRRTVGGARQHFRRPLMPVQHEIDARI